MTTLACVIPVFNEAKFIAGVLAGIPDRVEHIIVVDDASTDHTASVLSRIADPRLLVFTHAQNKGVGGAMATGYREALKLAAGITVKLDGDGQMDPANIERLVSPIERGEADYVKGARFHDRSVLRKMPKTRLIGNLGLSFLTKAASGYWNIFDPTNGFTAIELTALERLELDRLSQGFFFETDLLSKLYLIDAVVVDVPLPAKYGAENSHLRPALALLTFPGRLLLGLSRRILWRYFLRDFTAVSAFLVAGSTLFVFGLAFGLYKWTLAILTQVPTPIGTVMVAALPFILGFQLLLQAAVLDIGNVPKRPIQDRDPGLGS